MWNTWILRADLKGPEHPQILLPPKGPETSPSAGSERQLYIIQHCKQQKKRHSD